MELQNYTNLQQQIEEEGWSIKTWEEEVNGLKTAMNVLESEMSGRRRELIASRHRLKNLQAEMSLSNGSGVIIEHAANLGALYGSTGAKSWDSPAMNKNLLNKQMRAWLKARDGSAKAHVVYDFDGSIPKNIRVRLYVGDSETAENFRSEFSEDIKTRWG